MILSERYKYRVEIQQMMFVSGATNDPPLDTIVLVEDIVRAQVVEIVSQCTALARRRGARSISVDDVMFLFYHDSAKVNLLVNYLTWKDVRKNTRDTEAAPDGTEILEDSTLEPTKKPKKPKFSPHWRLAAMFNIDLPDDNDEEESDEEDDEANAAMVERLKNADERTRNMTKEEYVHWSECRQASFTYRKAKRFKDWVGVNYLTDSRLSDDIVDILGFLTFEIVANLTERALKIKTDEKNQSAQTGGTGLSYYKKQNSLFDKPNNEESPLLPKHIREAWRRYQHPGMGAYSLRTFSRGNSRYKTRFI